MQRFSFEQEQERVSAEGKGLYFSAIALEAPKAIGVHIDNRGTTSGSPASNLESSQPRESVGSDTGNMCRLQALDLDTGAKSTLEKMNEDLLKVRWCDRSIVCTPSW